MTGRALRSAFAGACLLSLSACVSSGAGFDLARDTVRKQSALPVPDDEDAARIKQELLAKPLTADAAARLALVNSAGVEVALSNVGVARADLVRALRLPNPSAHLGVRFEEDGNTVLDLEASLDIIQLALVPARESSASERLDAAALESAGALVEVAYSAKIAFYEYLAAAQTLELERTNAYAAAQSSAIAESLREAGNTPELNALTERALYEESKLGVARAEVAEVAARERLNASLGLFGPEGAAWRVDSRLAEPDEFDGSALEARAIKASLELGALGKRYGAASIEKDVAWAQGFLPGVGVGVGAERDQDAWGVGPVVSVQVPLFYQGQGEVASAEAQMNAAKNGHLVMAVKIRATARALESHLRNARGEAAFYKNTLLPLREKIVSETLRQYNAMDRGPAQVLQAKRDHIAAMRAYVDVLRGYWVARAQVEMMLAGRSPGMPSVAPPSSLPSAGSASEPAH